MKERRVYKKTISCFEESAVLVYRAFVKDKEGFLLESYDKENGRYVFLGKEPELYIRSDGMDALILTDKEGEIRKEGNPKEILRDIYQEYEIVNKQPELPFQGGFVGAFGYDYVRFQEELPDENEDEIGIEPIQLMLVTEYICVDLEAETLSFIVLEEANEEGKKRASEKLKKMQMELEEGKKQVDKDILNREEECDGVIVKQSDTLEQYTKKVEAIKQYIKDGHVFQTVLSQRWTVSTKQDGMMLYQKLRKLNPSPYMYYFRFPDFEIIGSSPEMVVKSEDSKVFTCPIAGTRKRGKTKDEDDRLREELLGDEKERAEHVMLVDLARNDMGRISEFGTVKVKDFMQVQNYSHVMHIVSLVEGIKKKECLPFDLLNSFLPAGTLSGAPKVRAMEIIDELESVKRGLYGGATGYIDFSGNIDFCITIRTMIKKEDKVYLQAGAGIVADSKPELEYKECQNKVRALAAVLLKEEEK